MGIRILSILALLLSQSALAAEFCGSLLGDERAAQVEAAGLRRISSSLSFERSGFLVQFEDGGKLSKIYYEDDSSLIKLKESDLIGKGFRKITDHLYSKAMAENRGIILFYEDSSIRVFRLVKDTPSNWLNGNAELVGFINSRDEFGRDYKAIDIRSNGRTYAVKSDGSMQLLPDESRWIYDYRIAGKHFAGSYDKIANVPNDQFFSADTPISDLIDSKGNIIVFRAISQAYNPSSNPGKVHGISYSVSPNIARSWVSASDSGGFVVVSEQNIYRDDIGAGQTRITGKYRRLTANSKITEQLDGEISDAGLNEVTLPSGSHENAIAVVPRRRFLQILNAMPGKFVLSDFLRRLSGAR